MLQLVQKSIVRIGLYPKITLACLFLAQTQVLKSEHNILDSQLLQPYWQLTVGHELSSGYRLFIFTFFAILYHLLLY